MRPMVIRITWFPADAITSEIQGQRVPAKWQSIGKQLGKLLGKLVGKSEKELRKLRQQKTERSHARG